MDIEGKAENSNQHENMKTYVLFPEHPILQSESVVDTAWSTSEFPQSTTPYHQQGTIIK
jgi:hypothetical protein